MHNLGTSAVTRSGTPLGAALRKRESHLWHRDLHDWYVEPIWVSERLFATVPFITGILDPACGCGRW
jgi:hypothetical protein